MGITKLSAIALVSVLGTVGAVVVPVGVAQAGPVGDWDPVVDLSRRAPNIYEPDVAVDPTGGAAAAWVRSSVDRSGVFVASRREGRPWRAPVRIPGTRGAAEVELAVSGDGERILVWTSGRKVEASRKLPGHRWSDPAVLHRTASGRRGVLPTSLQLAVNRRGRAVAAWQTLDDDEDAVHARSRVQASVGRAGGDWTPMRTLSAPRVSGGDPEAVVGRAGRTTMVWSERAGTRAWVRTVSREKGEPWGEARSLSRRSGEVGRPQVAVRRRGEIAVAWVFQGETRSGVRLRRWSPATGWGEAARVPAIRRGVTWIDLGLDRSRTATVAWANKRGGVWTAKHTPAGTWTREHVAPPGSVFDGITLVVNRAGDAVLGWGSSVGGDHPVQAAYRRRSSGWGSVNALSSVSGDAFRPALALDGAGDAVAVWSHARDISSPPRVQARSLDAR